MKTPDEFESVIADARRIIRAKEDTIQFLRDECAATQKELAELKAKLDTPAELSFYGKAMSYGAKKALIELGGFHNKSISLVSLTHLLDDAYADGRASAIDPELGKRVVERLMWDVGGRGIETVVNEEAAKGGAA